MLVLSYIHKVIELGKPREIRGASGKFWGYSQFQYVANSPLTLGCVWPLVVCEYKYKATYYFICGAIVHLIKAYM